MNYKVKCTGYNAKEKNFTIGKVYDVIDNTIRCDDGFYYTSQRGKNNILEWLKPWYNFEVVENNKIVITTNGTETLARLYEGNKVIKTATAKCSPEDKFDALIGAKIAFDRLVENKPADKWRVVNRPVKMGDYIRLKTTPWSFNEKGDIMRVSTVRKYICKVRADEHPRPTSVKDGSCEWCYENYTYEVVEPITPEEKPKYYNGKAVCVKCKDHDYTVGKVYKVVNGKLKDDKGNIRPHGYALKELSDYSNTTSQYEFIPLVE